VWGKENGRRRCSPLFEASRRHGAVRGLVRVARVSGGGAGGGVQAAGHGRGGRRSGSARAGERVGLYGKEAVACGPRWL
jgi:hypothetical protein